MNWAKRHLKTLFCPTDTAVAAAARIDLLAGVGFGFGIGSINFV
jgi:hypothetical protein